MLAVVDCAPVISSPLFPARQSSLIMINPMSGLDSSFSPSSPTNENDAPPKIVSSPNNSTIRFPPRRSSLSPVIDHLTPVSKTDFFSTISKQKSPSLANDDIIEEEEKDGPLDVEITGAEPPGWGLGLINIDAPKPRKGEEADTAKSVQVQVEAEAEAVKDAIHTTENPSFTINFEFEELKLDTSMQDLDQSSEKQSSTAPSVSSTRSPTIDSESTLAPSPELTVDGAATSRTKAPQGTLASRIRRRSWMPASRSPSPKKTDRKRSLQLPEEHEALDEPLTMSTGRKDRLSTVISSSRPTSQQRNSSFSKQFAQRLRKRPAGVATLDTVVDESPSKSSESLFSRMQKSASEDKLSIPTLVPSTRSSDRLSSYVQSDSLSFPLTSKARQARKRDELWSTFRDLDSACQR
jgi:hypothetical protein